MAALILVQNFFEELKAKVMGGKTEQRIARKQGIDGLARPAGPIENRVDLQLRNPFEVPDIPRHQLQVVI